MYWNIFDRSELKSDFELKISWSRLWQFLKKYAFQLGFGVAMAVTAAYFNLQIPICLGSITTVLADIIKRETVVSANEYFEFGDRLCFIVTDFEQKEK